MFFVWSRCLFFRVRSSLCCVRRVAANFAVESSSVEHSRRISNAARTSRWDFLRWRSRKFCMSSSTTARCSGMLRIHSRSHYLPCARPIEVAVITFAPDLNVDVSTVQLVACLHFSPTPTPAPPSSFFSCSSFIFFLLLLLLLLLPSAYSSSFSSYSASLSSSSSSSSWSGEETSDHFLNALRKRGALAAQCRCICWWWCCCRQFVVYTLRHHHRGFRCRVNTLVFDVKCLSGM